MRTDVVLEAEDRCLILDTKFYAEALKGRFEQKKVDSGHL
jgi:5-methylcytosine-specific restriction endonuclease McrBC regulatory subunit McrC